MDLKPLITLLALVNPLGIVPFFISFTVDYFARAPSAHHLGRRPGPSSSSSPAWLSWGFRILTSSASRWPAFRSVAGSCLA